MIAHHVQHFELLHPKERELATKYLLKNIYIKERIKIFIFLVQNPAKHLLGKDLIELIRNYNTLSASRLLKAITTKLDTIVIITNSKGYDYINFNPLIIKYISIITY